ncbi:hypothetical protein [Cohaesibacter celericrescens]|uniref:hypothetical protein n=1 Tax=Cohaesibacter celericrescens TaxID=2067669 RepID=UPI0035665774
MKMTAIALPLLIAATFSMPAQARDAHAPRLLSNFELTISSGKHVDRYHFGPTKEQRKNKARGHRFNRLPPNQIANIVHNRGFYNVRNMRTDGHVYTLKANGRRGNVVRLTVNARTGKIIDSTNVRPAKRINRSNNYHNHRGWTQSRNMGQGINRQPFWMH